MSGCWGDSEAARALGIRTYVSAPVRAQDGKLLGTRCAASSQPASPYRGASVGVVAVPPGTLDADEAIAKADAAMYRVKQRRKAAGRV